MTAPCGDHGGAPADLPVEPFRWTCPCVRVMRRCVVVTSVGLGRVMQHGWPRGGVARALSVQPRRGAVGLQRPDVVEPVYPATQGPVCRSVASSRPTSEPGQANQCRADQVPVAGS